jgi:multidrug efflux pump subunit AcrA (membrane-fusion protein)
MARRPAPAAAPASNPVDDERSKHNMKERSSKPVKWLLLVLLIAVVAGGGYWLYASSRTSKAGTAASTAYTQVTDVKQGNLSTTLSVVGQLQAVQQADLAFERMSGTTKLLKLEVKTGTVVTAGQVLATIDAAPYQQALDQAKSDLQAAQESLSELKTPATTLEKTKSDAAVAKAEVALEQAKKNLADLQAPDIAALKDAVANAEDSLALAQLQQTVTEHDATAKNEREASYALDFHERKVSELQDLVAHGKANLEQTNAVATEQDAVAKARADLAATQVRRQVALQTAAAKVATAKEALVVAQDALNAAQAGGDKLALAQAQLAVQSAEVTLATAKDDRSIVIEGADATTLAAAQAAVDKKQLALTNAGLALAGTKLTAPFSGTVLQTKVAAGNLIGSGTSIVSIADLKSLEVVASVDETTIKRVSSGQTAQVTFDALVGQTLRGQVGEVPLQGALQGGVMVYQVEISLTGADKLPLLVGMTANVKIQTGQAQNALLVPAIAVQRGSSGYQVLTPNVTDPQGTPTVVSVEIGLSDGVNTQITKGLNLGDKVMVQLASTTSTTNNQRGGFSIFGLSLGR